MASLCCHTYRSESSALFLWSIVQDQVCQRPWRNVSYSSPASTAIPCHAMPRRITQFPRPVGGDAARTWLLIGRRYKPFYSDYSEKDIYGDFSIKSLRTPLAINIFQKKILTMCGFVPRLCSFLTDLSCRLPRLLG